MAFSKENTILGLGKITIGGTELGYSRGGARLTVERTYHDIVADGDRGTHKGAVIIDEERAKLTVSFIEITAANLVNVFPALSNTTGLVKPTFEVDSNDYHEVVWTGKTKGGKAVQITLHNAIVKDNIDWTLAEKDEVVQTVTFEATYTEQTDLSTYVAPYEINIAQ